MLKLPINLQKIKPNETFYNLIIKGGGKLVQLHQLVKKAQKGNEQSFLKIFNDFEN